MVVIVIWTIVYYKFIYIFSFCTMEKRKEKKIINLYFIKEIYEIIVILYDLPCLEMGQLKLFFSNSSLVN